MGVKIGTHFIIALFLLIALVLPTGLGNCDCDLSGKSTNAVRGTLSSPLSDKDILSLHEQEDSENWTFSVGVNSATNHSLEELCGLAEPDDWWVDGPFDSCSPDLDQPSRFDWRDYDGLTPIKNQGSCGSCWAFGTVGPLESNIKLKEGITVDLSEQWLLSCNKDGWSCNGGWWAHDYHMWKTDTCGGTGGVLETYFPYVAYKAPCNCPYPHEYLINDWAYIGEEHGIPPVDAIKQAIMSYGPVSVAIVANSAFHAYTSGIFNACSGGWVNHAVVLVGWDDDQGSNGVWFLRNSWGTGWGEDGYMRIEYVCSKVGYAACYIYYPGISLPPQVDDVVIGDIVNDGFFIKSNITNNNLGHYSAFDWEIRVSGYSPLGLYLGGGPIFMRLFKGNVFNGRSTNGTVYLSPNESANIISGPLFGLGHILVNVSVSWLDNGEEFVTSSVEDGSLFGRRLLLHYPEE